MKLAHFVLAHNNPVQLERLVNRLSHEYADIFIHLDRKTDIEPFRKIEEIKNVSFIKNRVDVKWGEYSIIRATLVGLDEILKSGVAYSHINYLSGNDYPLQSAGRIQQFLFANPGKTYMWYDAIFNDWVHGQVRINTYYLGDYGFPGRYQLSAILNKILPKRKMPGDLVPYGRSQWLTLSTDAAKYVVKYIQENPDIERFFRMTWAVDEVFFQTILCNSPLRDTIVNDNLRYFKITSEFRPVIYTLADGPALIASGKLYARKFDINIDARIFDFLDENADK